MTAEIWVVIGVGVGLAALVWSVFSSLDARISTLDTHGRGQGERLAKFEGLVSAITEAVNASANERVAALKAKIEADLDRIEADIIGKIKADSDARAAQFRTEFKIELRTEIEEVTGAHDEALRQQIADSITRGLRRS